MASVREYVRSLPRDTVVVTGGWRAIEMAEATPGVDLVAFLEADRCGLVAALAVGSKAIWTDHAGLQRNPVIVEISDAIVAFWDLESRGTADTLRHARDDGTKSVIVVGPDGYQVESWQYYLG